MVHRDVVRHAAFIGDAAPAFFAWTHHAPETA